MDETISFDTTRGLLQRMVQTPSFSRQEGDAADLLAGFLADRGVVCRRSGNNLWAYNRAYDPARPTLLLNSHLDTVRPNGGYTRDPFDGEIADGRLYGLVVLFLLDAGRAE